MRAVIRPGQARGTVEAPPSKSMAHRLLICAALALGESAIRRLDPSEDILATADCLRALGAKVDWRGDTARVVGCDPRTARPAALNCRESGSTLRFLIPLCLLSGAPARLIGSARLMARPLSIYERICRERGWRFENDGRALRVQGRLTPGEYTIEGGVSSQFASGLLFSLPLLDGDSLIRLIPPIESRPYIDLTLGALNAFGVGARWADGASLFVPGPSAYAPREAAVEGDWSNAAYLDALNLVGGEVRVTGLDAHSLQSDRVYPAYFDRLARGDAELDVGDCPDLAPVLLAIAAARHGCTLTGARRLRDKESDRGAAMAAELSKLGASVEIGQDAIRVRPAPLHPPRAPLSSHNDHRVAMALAVLCALTGGEIEGAEAVKKSFPGYWESLRGLGVSATLLH